MPRALFTLALVSLTVLPAGPSAQGPSGPRLVVLMVVDQLRTDYLGLSDAHWRGGLRRLLDEGAVFERGAYPYLNTVTCAGHSTIGTGAFPHTHGQILNEWFDRDRSAAVTCTADPDAADVTYDREARLANSGRSLLVPTLADEVRRQKAGARAVAVAFKARSAIGLAGHGGVVTWADDGARGFVTSRAFSATPVAEVSAFLTREPLDADAGRVWTLRDDPGSYRYPDASLGARPPARRTGLFPHAVGEAGTADPAFYTLWQHSPYLDAYVGRMAAALVDAFRLGRRDTTDFLGVSFSALDIVGHAFGPESREVEDLLRHLDDTIGTLLTHLDTAVGRGNWVLGLSADHGVAPIPHLHGGGRIIGEDIGDRVEETLLAHYGPRTSGRYVASVTHNYVYFAPGIAERLRSDAAALAAVERAILSVPGTTRVLRTDDLSSTSSDPEIRAAALSHYPGRSGDLVVIGRENWYFSTRAGTAATSHGSGHAYDQRVPLILLGAGVQPGRYTQAATPADLAPTLAHLAGVTMPQAEGRVLYEALR